MASPDRLDAMTWGLHVLMVLRRGVMRQGGEADVEAAPEPAAPSGNFAETVTREGMWFPRG
jgi:hypothetical protein